MTNQLLKNPELQFGALTFFAKQHKGDTCGSNGLPLTPNSIIIYGKAQILKTIKHPNMCEYLDIIRGKHERTIVVSQYCGKPLIDLIESDLFTAESVIKISYQILLALNFLHKKNIVHRNLSSENILLQENDDIKLFNYGLYHLTGCGNLVSFPILQVLYAAPEVILAGPSIPSSYKVDIWSFGIVLAELLLKKNLWNSLKIGQRIRKVTSLLHCNTSIFERIAREHNCFEQYKELPEDIKDIVECCLAINPRERPTTEELLKREIFNPYRNVPKQRLSKLCDTYEVFTIKEFYHWWKLAGGDVFQELKKQGLIRSSPPVLSLPILVLNEGTLLGQDRNPATLFDPRIVKMPLDSLYQRFSNIPASCYYPLLHNKSAIIASSDILSYDARNLPLIIKERDPEYQFHRIILFRRLLHGFPYTKDLLIKEANIDIPPLLRGEIWAALLNIRADYEREYLRIDKETATTTDRQIEVDIPRCHQYNEFLSSLDGHKKLKKILKAWVHKNSQYVYWQGLDSLTAPFLYLNFNNEAKAFACLSAFVPKYLHKFFLRDNSAVIHEYLGKFSELIAFHDPKLANHLQDINFYPELFAIPWFLTVFSHVFPLYKILHLWDKLLLGDSSFPLHIGLSVLTQLRDRLLTSGFNECILLFSDLPEVDIEKCVDYSTGTFKNTPKSITRRVHENEEFIPKDNNYGIPSFTPAPYKKDMCPRISVTDVVDLILNNPQNILTVDVRNPLEFGKCSVVNSLNIPFSSITFGAINLDNIGPHSVAFKSSNEQIVVVIGNKDTDIELFPKFLVKCHIKKVCVLEGGFEILLGVTPSILVHQSHM